MDHPVYAELVPQPAAEVLLLFTGGVDHCGASYHLHVHAFRLSLN